MNYHICHAYVLSLYLAKEFPRIYDMRTITGITWEMCLVKFHLP